MKRIYMIFALLVSAGVFIGCDSFLDTENLTKKDTSNFPKTEDDAKQMIAGIYAVMNNGLEEPESDPFFVFELAGDDRLGGGSQSNFPAQSLDRLMNCKISAFEPFWRTRYAGIFRANSAIATMDNVASWTSEKTKDNLLSEAYFLRGFYYFQLVQTFGQVPLVVSTVAENLPKAEADEIYAQIASDLKTSIELGSNAKWPDLNIGHATKWVAEAIMARVWLFYTGFYNKTELPLAEGGSVSKSQVVAWLEDCIQNSGHALVSDQRNLWPYTNPYTAKDYPYARDNGLVWESDENIENMFAVKMSNAGTYEDGLQRHNRIVEYFGLRKSATAFPFYPQGYSNGPVCEAIWKDWGNDPDYAGDYRRVGSICKRADELPDYPGDDKKECENTDLVAKKYLGCGAYDDAGTLYESYAYFYGGDNDKQTGLTQSLVWLRFADVLLMHAELTDGKQIYNGKNGLNAVRQRAKLNDLPYSLEALKKERRYELCFEAMRWNDLRRWGDVSVIVANQEGNDILNEGKPGKYTFGSNDFMQRYNATKGGFFKLPDSQVTLSEGVLVQNDGWGEGTDHNKGDLPYFKK